MLCGFGAVRRASSKVSLQARSTPSGSFGGEIGGRQRGLTNPYRLSKIERFPQRRPKWQGEQQFRFFEN